MQSRLVVFGLVLVLGLGLGSLSALPVDATRWAPTYHPTDTMLQMYKELSAQHPTSMSYEVIGTSIEGREILLFKIGNPQGGTLLFDGRMHGPEDAGTEGGYLFAKWLLESGDPEAQILLQQVYVLIIPIVNMDTTARQNKRRAYHLANGTVLASPYGVDLNRNFGYNWGQSGSSDPFDDYSYQGAWAASEPETQAVRYAMETYRPHIYVNWHLGGEYAFYRNLPEVASVTARILAKYDTLLTNAEYSPLAGGIWGGGNRMRGGGGFAISDGAYFGASSWLIEAAAWDDVPAEYTDFVAEIYAPKMFPILLAMCQAIAVPSPITLQLDGVITWYWESR